MHVLAMSEFLDLLDADHHDPTGYGHLSISLSLSLV